VLLDLIGAHIPVQAWPTQLSKSDRTAHAREATQADAAEADRPPAAATSPDRHDRTGTGSSSAAGGQGWPQRAAAARQAVDGDRAGRRREAMAAQQVHAPARLGDGFRRGNLFLLPDEPADGASDASGPGAAS
jgi:hypothetical protein